MGGWGRRGAGRAIGKTIRKTKGPKTNTYRKAKKNVTREGERERDSQGQNGREKERINGVFFLMIKALVYSVGKKIIHLK